MGLRTSPKQRPLFVRRKAAALVAAAVATSGCSTSPAPQVSAQSSAAQSAAQPTATKTVQATATRTKFVEIAPLDAELWDFQTTVVGSLRGGLRAEDCSLHIGPRQVDVEPHRRGFVAHLRLDSGPQRVAARCRDARGRLHSSAAATYTVRLPDAPKAQLTAKLEAGRVVLDAGSSSRSPGSKAPLERFSWALHQERAAVQRWQTRTPQTTSPRPEAPGIYTYELTVVDARGQSDTARVELRVRDGAAELATARSAADSWIDGAVLYGVVPPLFGDPPLRGVRAAVPRLADLGVTALWLSPVFATPPGDFGYAVTDYFDVREDYGTAEDLRALVAEAHRHGLRVLLDFVPNHTSDRHPYFAQAENWGSMSHYHDFYERDSAGRATHYFDWTNLPNLSFDHPEVGRWMTAAGRHWLRSANIDGYRVDVAWGIQRRKPEWWRQWSDEMYRERPDALLIAEASAREADYLESGFGAAYDWSDLGKWAWEGVFDTASGIPERMHAAVRATASQTPRDDRVLRFLNNNDTGQRFITKHGLGMTKAATAALLTLPGIPCLYSFDEVGAEFEPYGELRPIVDRPHPELEELHRELIGLRKSLSALHGAGYRRLATTPEGDVLAFARYHAGELALVAVHFGAEPTTVTLDVPRELSSIEAKAFRDLLSGRQQRLREGQLAIDLPPFGSAIYVPETKGRSVR